MLHKSIDSPTTNNTLVAIAKGDRTATHNYWKEEDQHCLTSLQPAATYNVILPIVPNAKAITPS